MVVLPQGEAFQVLHGQMRGAKMSEKNRILSMKKLHWVACSLLFAGCGLPRHPPEDRLVRIDTAHPLFHDQIIMFRKQLIEVTLCAKLPPLRSDQVNSTDSEIDSSILTRYWLNPELNKWKVKTTLTRNDSTLFFYISNPTSKRPEIKGDLRNPIVCRTVWGGRIPPGISEMKIELTEVDSTLAPFPGRLMIYTPYYLH
ncbi:MAG: hypothetical protein IPO40_20620 [Fibrobacteres bacterium]|nr:hypothetical protein [Fibrobacterota bacterium]